MHLQKFKCFAITYYEAVIGEEKRCTEIIQRP